MKRASTLMVAAAGALLLTTSASAHHSFAAEFDRAMPITVTGTVTKVEWMNPHARFYIDAKDDAGKTVNWDFELASPNGLMRRGWNRNSMKIGDTVTVTGHRAKNNPLVGNASTVTLGDGKRLFAGSSIENEPAQQPAQPTQQYSAAVGYRTAARAALGGRASACRVAAGRGAMADVRGEARAAQAGRHRQPRSSGAADRRRAARPIGALGARRPRRRQPEFRRAAIAGRRPPSRHVLEPRRRRSRRPAFHAARGDAARRAHGGQPEEQPRRVVPADGLDAAAPASATAQDRADAGPHPDDVRGQRGLRQIFTDGRPLPVLDENLQPWWYGYSVGRWEGDDARRRDGRLPRRRLARRAGRPVDGPRQDDGTLSPTELSARCRST